MVGEGTTTYTVQSVIDRLYMQYLSPPSARGANVRLSGSISTTSQTSFVLGNFAVPEDEALMRQGSYLEGHHELMEVVSWDEAAKTVTVNREQQGTVATTHASNTILNINPEYPRAAVFEAVADNIITLYPSLFTVINVNLEPVGYQVYPIPDPLVANIREVRPVNDFETVDIHAELSDYHHLAGGRAMITSAWTGTVWARFVRRMTKPTAESDTLTSLGMDDRWANIVMAGAAADLMAGKDVSASQTEWVKSVLEAENIRVGTRMSIAGGLRQYRAILLRDAVKEMRGEYRPRVQMRNPMRQIT